MAAAWRGAACTSTLLPGALRHCLPAAPPLPCKRAPHTWQSRGRGESLSRPATGAPVDSSSRGPRPLRNVIWGPEVGGPAVRLEPLPPLPPSGRECEEFDAVWYDLARQLQMGKNAAAAVALMVQRGKLPCDAPKLHARAKAFLEATALSLLPANREPAVAPALRTRQLLSEMPGLVLRYPAGALTRVARRLHTLLPSVDPTLLLATLMEDLPSAAPELLALKFMELSSVFRMVFGTDVPQRIFHYLSADVQQQRHRKRMRQQQMQEQRLWTRQQQVQEQVQVVEQRSPPPPVQQQASRRDRAASAPLSQSDSASLSPLQLQSRLLALCSVLGRQVAFVVLCNQPELLDLDPATAQQRLAALKALVGLEDQKAGPGQQQLEENDDEEQGRAPAPAQSRAPPNRLVLLRQAAGRPGPSNVASGAVPLPGDMDELESQRPADDDGGSVAALWWMLERRGDVLLMPSEQLQANLDALTEGLGWPAEEVVALVREEPLAVLMDWRTVAARAGQLEGAVVMTRLTGQRAHWHVEFASGKVPLVGLLLRRSCETLDRLDFLLQHAAARPSVPLLRVLAETKADFLRLCPAYRTWRVQGQASRSALPPDLLISAPQSSVLPEPQEEQDWGTDPRNLDRGPAEQEASRTRARGQRAQQPQGAGRAGAKQPKGSRPLQQQRQPQRPPKSVNQQVSSRRAAAARAATAASLHRASLLLGQDDDIDDAGLVLLEQ